MTPDLQGVIHKQASRDAALMGVDGAKPLKPKEDSIPDFGLTTETNMN